MTKQIVMVLEAIENGCETSADVAIITGLSIATCSAWITKLSEDGLIEITRRAENHTSILGRSYNWWRRSS